MNCENNFCIYWSEDNCLLEEISLDIAGICKSRIYINIDNIILDAYRKDTLEKIERDGDEPIKNE